MHFGLTSSDVVDTALAILMVESCELTLRNLDALADVESRGAATVWRLTEASLVRAYDAGWTADTVRSVPG